MLIISLTYLKSTEEADRFMQGHMEWVKRGYLEKGFIASGRKVPRTGGVILAKGNKEDIQAYLDIDPFATEGIASYDVVEVDITTVTEGFEQLRS
ncbi:YciI family protein [Oryzifoliimicrobium ureilyticus]|uniref:YciI family protein n=1 Tax=Oryzifoliimicrobium ureilyticus TaxID=3113724 RepID=UPI003075F273